MPARIALLLLLVAACGCKPPLNSGGSSLSSPARGSAVGPGGVIPVGTIAADVMEFGQSPRVAELNKRKQDAILKDPLREHMKQQKPGEPITYDSRMGITQAEFDELKALSGKTTMRKKADATIAITSRNNGVLVFDGGQSLPDLTGVEIDLASDVVRMPLGVTGKHRAITMPDTSPGGSWTGIRWSLGNAADQKSKNVSLAIGRLKASGRGILIYYVNNPDAPPEQKKRVNVMLQYDLPATP